MDLNRLSLKKALIGLKNKDFSAVELVESYLAQMEKFRNLNAYILELKEQALENAKLADKRIANNTARILEGVPIAVKDLFCTKGIRTTAGSKMLENFVPSYTATVVKNLQDKGAIMIGKTNLDEFAMGTTNISSYFGSVINPWRNKNDPKVDLVPGGSSGGSSASVAGFLSIAALGTDTGGSIRQPAAFTGTVGIKPTYGRCSRYGIIAFASSLDHAGVIARSVEDGAIILENMMGHDEKDSTSEKLPVPELSANISKDIDSFIKNMVVGIPKDLLVNPDLNPEILNNWKNVIELLEKQGVKIVDITLPHLPYAIQAYYIIAPAEASSNLAKYDGIKYGYRHDANNLEELYFMTRTNGFGKEVKRRIMLGTYVLSSGFKDAYYSKALKVKKLIIKDFQDAFSSVDAILLPSTPNEAFPINNKQSLVDAYLNDIFTAPANIAGLPALSLPTDLSKNGLPLSIQLITAKFNEEKLLKLAYTTEKLINKQFIPGGFA